MSVPQLTRKQLLSAREVQPSLWLYIAWGVVLVVASYDVVTSPRTWSDIVNSAIPVAIGFFAIFVLAFASVALAGGPKINWGGLAAGVVFSAVFAPFIGLMLYIVGAEISDAFVLARAGVKELNQPVTWSNTRALIVGGLIPLVLGTLFFGLRLKFRTLYGVSEVVVGIIVATFKYVEPTRESIGTGSFQVALLTASVYLVVRGLDNIHQGLKDPKDPLVAYLPWLRNRRLDLKLEAVQEGIRTKSRVVPGNTVDPLEEIKKLIAAAPSSSASKTMSTIVNAITERKDSFDENGVWALGADELGLIEALIEEKLAGYL